MNNMLEVLQFIFQDGWHWLGTAFLLLIIAAGISGFVTINYTKTIIKPEKEEK